MSEFDLYRKDFCRTSEDGKQELELAFTVGISKRVRTTDHGPRYAKQEIGVGSVSTSPVVMMRPLPLNGKTVPSEQDVFPSSAKMTINDNRGKEHGPW